MVTISAPRVVAPDSLLEPGTVELTGDRVTGVRPGAGADIELATGVLAPGLVDIQVNGCFGVDLVDASARDWDEVCARLPSTGVTSFQPTFISAPVNELAAALRRAAGLLGDRRPGARPLGVHLEGPYLSALHNGAHDLAVLVDPTPESVRTLLAAAPGLLTMVTLAPERTGALSAVADFVAAGVRVSIGHSDATAEQVAAAADAGATMVTHLFNAQRGLHHREPGVPGHALVDPRLRLGLISDLVHVDAEVLRLVWAAAGDRVVLVTDAVAAAGMPPGEYVLGGQRIVQSVDGPPVRTDGVIAGSALRADDAVAHTVGLGVGVEGAVRSATQVPADVLGHSDIGRLSPGARADLVWLDDSLRTRATWLAGEQVYGDEVA